MGVGGSCVSVTSDYGTGNSPLIRRYTSIPESDIITIYMGTNDYGHETPMGTINDLEDVSFYGALNVIIPGIQKAQPNAKLVWITPTHRYGFGTSKLLGTPFTYDYLPNGRGYSLNDYVDAIKEVCEKYDVPVIDLFTLSGMDPSLSEVRTQYMPDGLHPNAAGHEKIAAIIAKSLEGILVGK
jgi:lysophospholipase L1-like esterase